jgi:hypothetical protein
VKNLTDILIVFRGNLTKTAKFLRVNRGSLRAKVESDQDFLIHEGKVYKQIGNPDWSQITDIEKRAKFESECG